LTATEYEAVSTQVITRWTNLSGKPMRRSRCHKNAYWTESKAFLKSIFIRHLGEALFRSYCLRSSCKRLILSAIRRPPRKAFCMGLIMPSRACPNLSARIFEMIL
jgi:hypothetical protein